MRRFQSKFCDEWEENKLVNPESKKTIRKNGPTFNLYKTMCEKYKPKLKKEFQMFTYYNTPILIMFVEDLKKIQLTQNKLSKISKTIYDQEVDRLVEKQMSRLPEVRNTMRQINLIHDEDLIDAELLKIQEYLDEHLDPNNYNGKARKIIEILLS